MNQHSTPSRRALRQGVVAIVVEQGRLLTIRRSQFVPAPLLWCLPGGGIEPGEEESAAVAREFREELGADVQPISAVWRSVTAWDVGLAWWQVRRIELGDLRPDPQEVAEFAWYTPEELAGLPDLLGSMHAFLDALERGTIRLE